jgi:aerobic carbon-monoxide dehydrogenase small subunit
VRVTAGDTVVIELIVNQRPWSGEIEAREPLSDVLRHRVGLTGTHVGCEHGVCGCCTILIDDEPARACLALAVQADGCRITTVESLSADGELHPLQVAFNRHHGLQCGFCTPGQLMNALTFYERAGAMTDDEIRGEMAGHLCRCTGYAGIIAAIRAAGQEVRCPQD